MTERLDYDHYASPGDHPIFPWLTERRRGYFYRLAFTASALAVALRPHVAGTAQTALEVVSAFLGISGIGLASGHTDVRR